MVPTSGDTRATLRGAVVSRRPRLRGHPLRRPEPGPLQVAQALPPGTSVASTQHAWLRALEEHPSVAQLRADAHAHLVAIAEVLAYAADWRSKTTRPTWERLCDRTGLGRRTVARWLAWLRTAGLLGVVESGSTPELRPMALAHLEGNRAALYVLATPAAAPVDESGTPSGLTEGESPSHARGDVDEQSPLRGPERRVATSQDAKTSWRWTEPTTHGRSRLSCAQRLQERVPALRRLSDRHLRHLLRPWLEAGWTAADVVWALDHTPDGAARTWTTTVRSPKGWLVHRLRPWTDVAGAPLRPLSALAAERAETTRREQAEHRAAAAARQVELEVERGLVDVLRDVAGEAWSGLLEVTARRLRRRQPGPMCEALARAAVVEALPVAPDVATPEQLRAAVEVARAREAA